MANISQSISITLDANHEGGFQKNPKDRANWTGGQVGVGALVGTNHGITALDMPGVDIENLTTAQAMEWYMTTRIPEQYNNPLYAEISAQAVCDKLFDMGVLFGVGTAVKALQTALGIAVDGAFGPASLAATNAANPMMLLADFQAMLCAHAQAVAMNPNDAPDLPDWERRIKS